MHKVREFLQYRIVKKINSTYFPSCFIYKQDRKTETHRCKTTKRISFWQSKNYIMSNFIFARTSIQVTKSILSNHARNSFRTFHTTTLKLSKENLNKSKLSEFGRLIGLAKPDRNRLTGNFFVLFMFWHVTRVMARHAMAPSCAR